MPKLICDTSVLVALHQVGLLDILPVLAKTVLVPTGVDAKHRGLIAAVAPVLDELDRHGFYMSPRIRTTVLNASGESP